MRIYNGTKSQLDLPLSGIQRISVPPRAVSGDIMPSNEFLSLLVSSFDYSEIALIVSGPYEISMCAGVSGSVGFVVQTLEEAIERFAEKKPEEVIVEAKVSQPEPVVVKPEEIVKPEEKNDSQDDTNKTEEESADKVDEQSKLDVGVVVDTEAKVSQPVVEKAEKKTKKGK